MVLPPKKQKFDIKKHLQDHAYLFKQFKEIDHDDIHFNFSYLDTQFFDKEKSPQEILEGLLKELMKPAQYKMRNGWRVLKDGTKNQKYTTRKINLKEAIKIVAIHIEGASGEYTMPHIHLILDKNARFEKNFMLLKKHIAEVSKKFGLKPNFEEIPQNNPMAYRNLGKAVKNFSWIIRKMPNDEFKSYVNKPSFINNIRKLREYTLLSGNLLYYIKTMNYIRKRLQNLKMDKIIMSAGEKFNLRNNYRIPLTEQDQQVLKLLEEKRFTQKEMKPYLKNAIMRDFIRYSYFKDKKKAIILSEILKQTEWGYKIQLRPNTRALNNYLKLQEKELELNREEAIKKSIEKKKKEKETESIKEILKEDLLRVAKQCKNEKELRQEMTKLGYVGFGFKKKSGKVFGYQFIPPNEDKKIVVKCSDTIAISEIRAILKENNLKAQVEKQEIKSKITEYTLPPDIRPQAKLLPVLYKKQIENTLKEIKKEAQKLKEESEFIPKPRVFIIKPQVKVTLPNVTLTIPNLNKLKERIRNAKQTRKRIRGYIREIKNNARELENLSRRKFPTARKSAEIRSEIRNIRRESEIFRERITEAIDKFANSINSTISKFRERIRRIRRVLSTKPRELLSEEEKIKIIRKLVKEAVEYSENTWYLTEDQIKKRVARNAEKFGIDAKYTNTYLFKRDVYQIAREEEGEGGEGEGMGVKVKIKL